MFKLSAEVTERYPTFVESADGYVTLEVFATTAVSKLETFGMATVPVNVGLVNIVALLSLVTFPKPTFVAVVPTSE